MAASNLMNLYRGPSIDDDTFHMSILLALFSQILNHKDSPSNHMTLSNPNFPK